MGILSKTVRLLRAAILAGMLVFPAAAPSWATQSGASMQLFEQKIKAGLVYNFLKSTSWPKLGISQAGGNGGLHVCLFGGDPFEGYLYPLEGRTAQRQVISIRHTNSTDGVDGCHVLFIHRSKEPVLSRLIESLEGKSILTMSDIDGFSSRGGMIELSTGEDRRVHLLVNKDVVEASGLTIQQNLLKLAQLVD